MRYLCVHCDHRFEHAGSEPPKRCPSCMRKGGTEAIEPAKKPEEDGERSMVVPVAAVLAIALFGGAYVLMNRGHAVDPNAEIAMAPLDRAALTAELQGRDVTAEPYAGLFEANDAVRALAERGVSGRSSNREKAEGVMEAIRELASEGKFASWALDVPRDTPPKTAGQIADALSDGEDLHLYPLEVAALAVSALRSEGVPAMLAEVWRFEGDRRPPDPSGVLGYFAVAVYDTEVGQGEPAVLDPYGGRASEPAEDSVRVLNDGQAAAAMMSLDAIFRNVQERDTARAMQRVEHALRLDPRAPYARGVRGAVLLSSGSHQEAIEELTSASEIRADPPRRLSRAAVLIATNDFDSASREVAAALEVFPDFALAHAFNGLLYLQGGDASRAREELEFAERLEPGLQKLPVWFAMLELESGNTEAAARHARRALDSAGLDPQAHLQVAQVFRGVGDFDSMRRAARRAVELTPQSMRSQVSQLVLRMLGPTALEEPEEWEEEGLGDDEWDDEGLDDLEDDELDDELDGDVELGGDLDLELGGGAPGLAPPGRMPGLGGGAGLGGGPSLGGGSGPSLLDDDGGDEDLGDDEGLGGPPVLMGSPSDYSLGGGRLRLDL